MHGIARQATYDLRHTCNIRARELLHSLHCLQFKICFTLHGLDCGIITSRVIQKFSFLCEDNFL